MIRLLVILLVIANSGCYFFRKKSLGDSTEENTSAVLGQPLGPKAGGPDYAALEELYGITTDVAPAAIRPDPDTYVRSLLLQYREEGTVVAREIGRVEQYRELLGGANEDFSKVPQDRYDATSLLASIKVAEEICLGLVAPTASLHPGWSTILPEAPERVAENIAFLAQRFSGLKNSQVSSSKKSALREIYDLAQTNSTDEYEDYVPVCATLAVDAEGIAL